MCAFSLYFAYSLPTPYTRHAYVIGAEREVQQAGDEHARQGECRKRGSIGSLLAVGGIGKG